MAPRIKVPADFGREHINSEVHGNLILKLKDGEQIRANSMIMSLNSPVIDNLISDLCQSTLEMDDFSSEVVNCFVDCMYTGEIEMVQKDIFEDVNKMAHAFKVSWLSRKCLKFYQTSILNFEKNTYDEILFACEIASRAHTNLKQTKFVKHFIKSAASWKVGKGIFLQRYMMNMAQLSKRQLDMSLAIAQNDLNLIANCLIFHISTNMPSQDIDESTLYLLKTVDCQKFASKFPICYKDFFHFICEVAEASSSDGIKPILEKFSRILSRKNDGEASEMCDSVGTEESDSASDLENDHENGTRNCTIQTDNDILSITDWKKVEYDPNILGKKTSLDFSGQNTGLEMVTTKNCVDKLIRFDFYFRRRNWNFNSTLRLYIKLHNVKLDLWSCVIEKCTEFKFRKNLLKNVPNHDVKLWRITKTTSNMEILCNGVTVLDFNFEADSADSYKECDIKWSEIPYSVDVYNQFSEHMFVRAT